MELGRADRGAVGGARAVLMGRAVQQLLCSMMVWTLSLATSAGAQDDFVGLDLGAFASGDRGIEATCGTSTAAGPSIVAGTRLWNGASAQAAVHVHAFDLPGAICAVAPLPPRADGTYVEHESTALLGAKFMGTDVRLRLGTETAGRIGVELSAGGGNMWRGGSDAPYVVAGIGLHGPIGPIRVVVRGELYQLRVGFHIVEETWLDSRLVSRSAIGVAHEWNAAARVSLGILVSLAR